MKRDFAADQEGRYQKLLDKKALLETKLSIYALELDNTKKSLYTVMTELKRLEESNNAN